ncbi:hypothetical protein K488DRAFT_74582 [Vararia minispora EC-137]|uniref:Uncharacterized protein n=1 Tax=Vararia minispora EC-137 TaxID=1314806 RepID=A0ACB8Q6G1_9AGAM|nr:hypothetical protein K488DRAFT_74582 [Vararia minispora EC-137]
MPGKQSLWHKHLGLIGKPASGLAWLARHDGLVSNYELREWAHLRNVTEQSIMLTRLDEPFVMTFAHSNQTVWIQHAQTGRLTEWEHSLTARSLPGKSSVTSLYGRGKAEVCWEPFLIQGDEVQRIALRVRRIVEPFEQLQLSVRFPNGPIPRPGEYFKKHATKIRRKRQEFVLKPIVIDLSSGKKRPIVQAIKSLLSELKGDRSAYERWMSLIKARVGEVNHGAYHWLVVVVVGLREVVPKNKKTHTGETLPGSSMPGAA